MGDSVATTLKKSVEEVNESFEGNACNDSTTLVVGIPTAISRVGIFCKFLGMGSG